MPKTVLAVPGAVLLGAPTATEQSSPATYARIAVLRPHDGKTVEFESGYIRHLDWHRQASDEWTWYRWSITYGDRQRWFIYATFGHRLADFDHPVAPADDERDNVLNVVPHAEFAGNGLFEFLPLMSRGPGVPLAAARAEMITVELRPGATKAFESALTSLQGTLSSDTLWFRLVAGGAAPRYVRLRPAATIEALAESRADCPPESVSSLVTKTTVEILTLRPVMSLGIK